MSVTIKRYRNGVLVSTQTGSSASVTLDPVVARRKLRDVVATWAELHSYMSTGDAAVDAAWLEDFSRRVPGVGCRCQREWREYVASNPPDFLSAWFKWTVDAHNAVNARLGKPLISINEAHRVWAI